jgi:hypothetical protein
MKKLLITILFLLSFAGLEAQSLSEQQFDALVQKYQGMEKENKIYITYINDPIIKLFPSSLQDYIVKELQTDKNLKNYVSADEQKSTYHWKSEYIVDDFYFFWQPKGALGVHVDSHFHNVSTITSNDGSYFTDKNGKHVTSLVEDIPGSAGGALEYGFNDNTVLYGECGYPGTKGYVKYIYPSQKAQTEYQIQYEKNMFDPEFASIQKDVYKVASTMQYDYYKAYDLTTYNGIEIKYKPDMARGVCDDYANTLYNFLSVNPHVAWVQKWAGGNHAFIVCHTKASDKTVYCDPTWYQAQGRFDKNGYEITTPVCNPIDITYDEALFHTLGGVDISTHKPVNEHIMDTLVKDSRSE